VMKVLHMSRTFFMKTDRVGFSKWKEADTDLASCLWGNAEVTRFICASGMFTEDEIMTRLETELNNNELFHMQYWPVFHLGDDEFIGCCGLRPHDEDSLELGFHLLPAYWHQGYAYEAAKAVMEYAFGNYDIEKLTAGHHPENKASEHVLKRLGFICTGTEYYPPTGLMHPIYQYLKEGQK